jgi:DNA-binding XRE family transcriptional regulator
MMKKEARAQAERIFIKTGGKITNREIAKTVEVNPLTVGRWKREDKWDTKLKRAEPEAAKAGTTPGIIVRKKVERDKALKIYMEMEGSITNKELAKRVGVSPATVSKWKEQDGWDDQLTLMKSADIRATPIEGEEIDIGELVSPEQIVEINRRIENLLARDYLTASEIADLATAKSDLLEAVLTYMDIVREIGEIETRG